MGDHADSGQDRRGEGVAVGDHGDPVYDDVFLCDSPIFYSKPSNRDCGSGRTNGGVHCVGGDSIGDHGDFFVFYGDEADGSHASDADLRELSALDVCAGRNHPP